MMQPHSSQQRNEGSTNSIEDLKRLQKDITFATHYMLREVKREDATIFMGSTRSGKSTLINYLIGNRLIGERVSEFRPLSITKLDDSTNISGPQIGTGPTSDTIFPSRWKSREPLGLTLWDVPGFDDNRGVVQDITNAFYVYELFKNLESAKIVLVTDINDIAHDSIRPFLCLLNSVEKILKGKMRECFPAIAIIFSKVPKEISGIPVNKKYINKLLEYQFLLSSSIDISEPAKDLVRHFIKNNQKIGFFKEATLGDITDTVINECIFEAVESATSINEEVLKQVSPSIAEASKLFLYRVREQLCAKETFMKLHNLLTEIFIIPMNDLESTNISNVSKEILSEQLLELEIRKSKFLQAVDSTIGFDKKLDAIRMIDSSVAKLVDEHNLLHAARLMEFCDQLLDLQESKQFDIYLQSLLRAALSNISELIINVKLKLSKISEDEAKRQATQLEQKYKEDYDKLINENESVKKHNTEIMQQFQDEIKMMTASQAEKDKQFTEYLENLKREQNERYEADRRERKLAMEDYDKLINENESVKKQNTELMQQFQDQVKMMTASQAEKDKQFAKYVENLRCEQNVKYEDERRKREQAMEEWKMKHPSLCNMQ